MSIDICMAVFNGCRFLEKQLVSIINNNDGRDEINFIIVDDFSSDSSTQLLDKFFKINPNIPSQIHQNTKNLGYVQTFGKSLGFSSAPTIMLADQDDIWPVNRIQFFKSALDTLNCELVIGNFSVLPVDSPQFAPSMHLLSPEDIRPFRTVTLFDYIFSSTPLFGCCFGFKQSLKKYILPIYGLSFLLMGKVKMMKINHK